MDFQRCGRYFEYKYVEKVDVEEKGVASTIGRNFHLFFQAFFSEVDVHDNMNTLECAEEIRRAALYVAAPMSGDLESYIDFSWATAKDYWKILNTFIDAEIARATYLSPSLLSDYYYPVEVEAKFNIQSLKFRGIIDRIDLDPSLSYLVLDYKTGKIYRDISKMRKELCFYAMGAKELGYDVTYGSMFFPRYGHVFLERLKKVSMTCARKTIESVRDRIEEGVFPCRVGHWCSSCPYFSMCSLE